MSAAVYGSRPTGPWTIPPGGEEHSSREEDVSVHVPSWLNRKTWGDVIKGYIEAAGGFDWRLLRRATIAELPNGDQFLIDGDHTRALYKIQYPNRKKFPAKVVKCADLAEVSFLFWLLNEGGRKNLKAEEIFIHKVRSGAFPTENSCARDLEKAGLFVTLGLSDNSKGQTVGSLVDGAYSVKIRGFKTILQGLKDDKASVYTASKMIRDSFSSHTKDNRKMAKELLWGLATLMHTMPALRDNPKFSKAMKEWLDTQASASCKQKTVSSNFKRAGGKVGNADALCIALGAYKSFRDYATTKSLISSKTFTKYCSKAAKDLKRRIDKS